MVEDRKVDYINSKRLDKPLVALEIIKEWRSQEPPGRFLKIDEKTGLWHDVGDKKARGKCHALADGCGGLAASVCELVVVSSAFSSCILSLETPVDRKDKSSSARKGSCH